MGATAPSQSEALPTTCPYQEKKIAQISKFHQIFGFPYQKRILSLNAPPKNKFTG